MNFIKKQFLKLINRFGTRNVIIGGVVLACIVIGFIVGIAIGINSLNSSKKNKDLVTQEESVDESIENESINDESLVEESTQESSSDNSSEGSSTSKSNKTDIVTINSEFSDEELEEIANDSSQDPQNTTTTDSSTSNSTSASITESVSASSEYAVGIDVSKWQGNISWSSVAASGIDFAMIRIGYRSTDKGAVIEDTYAEYNLKQAIANGIKVGVYFASTATTETEAKEEANWVVSKLSSYGVSLSMPIVMDYEGFTKSDSRLYGLTTVQRTSNALAFLKTVTSSGYSGMIYSSAYNLKTYLNISSISSSYLVWVAYYPSGSTYPDVATPSYSGTYSMWQYTNQGSVSGISGNVDLDVCYYMTKSTSSSSETTSTTTDSSTSSQDTNTRTVTVGSSTYTVPISYTTSDGRIFIFTQTSYSATPKEVLNFRTYPEQDDGNIAVTLNNGTYVTVVGTDSDHGWAQVIYNGNVYYCILSYLTTN